MAHHRMDDRNQDSGDGSEGHQERDYIADASPRIVCNAGKAPYGGKRDLDDQLACSECGGRDSCDGDFL
jgi:hypothetical protein